MEYRKPYHLYNMDIYNIIKFLFIQCVKLCGSILYNGNGIFKGTYTICEREREELERANIYEEEIDNYKSIKNLYYKRQ